jgi:glutathione S-transferase
MRVLFHLPLCPFSRKIRLVLAEKNLDAEVRMEPVWQRRTEFLELNPAAEVPVLVDETGAVIVDSAVICEYLEEVYRDRPLIGLDPYDRAEIRRLVAWFDLKMNREVTQNLVGEKIMKRIMGYGYPNASAIRAGHANIHFHLDYISYLVERRRWLAGENFSLADLAAAAHLSVLDYAGDVPWASHDLAKDWYARIKSRPSFRSLLADHVPGSPPPDHYADLDF